ncbi:hypothetical protein [Bradyrhizobium arachidis]|uniref:Uncharacterized protein n=1 Tax=Bradyrhizobium arachidis TaxID=858423 RepID=A0AAE7TJ72_9BRAD|nr:hypothetical protein [Bradyrhizobium arachidis]QOZ70285.1 hypothetical protein WN72_31305 [Bradyrhizobium arachidis]SFU65765.1 hypothetical protein SAMN05192541_103422 [Bradyrhizobium arachidis]
MSNEKAHETIRSLIEQGGPFDEEDLAAIREIEQTRAEIAQTDREVQKSLHTAIGFAITTWSSLEGIVVEIASAIIDAESEVGGVIFYNFPFAKMLEVIGEIVRVDERFQNLGQDWDKISRRLFALNDIRVRLAHHGLSSGKDILDFPLDITEFNSDDFLPSLEPYKADSRKKWVKKKRMSFSETVSFGESIVDAVEPLTEFLKKVHEIRIAPKRRLIARVKELQQKVREYESRETAQPTDKGED